MVGEGWEDGGWTVYYCYCCTAIFVIIPVVHGRFAARATAAAAADRCSFSLIISPLAVVAVVWLLLV